MKHKFGKKLIALALAAILFVGMIPVIPASAACTLPLPGYPAGAAYPKNQCWNFANMVYEAYWGYRFTNDQYSSDNLIKNIPITAEARQATPANLKKYITQAPIGSCVRISTSLDYVTAYSDGDLGHSFIVAGYDNDGFTCYDAGGGQVYFRYMTYDYFAKYIYVNSVPLGQMYLKYVKAGSGSSIEEAPSLPAAKTTVTREEAVTWAYWNIGASLDMDSDGQGDQDLIYYYYEYLGAEVHRLESYEYAYSGKALPENWERIAVTDGFVPQPGDIAVWKTNHNCSTCVTDSLGHVGIVTSADSIGVNVISQQSNSAGAEKWYYVSSLQCVIRPKFNTHTHDFSGSWVTTVTPTCQVTGIREKKCTDCDETVTETLPKTGHDWGTWTVSKPATATETGLSIRKCKNCSETQSEIIEKLPVTTDAKATLKSATARAGEEVRVVLNLQDAKSIRSIGIADLTYDKTLLTLVGGEWLISDALIKNWNNTELIGAAAFENPLDVAGDVFAFTFKVKDGAVDGLAFVNCTVKIGIVKDGVETVTEIPVTSSGVQIVSVTKGDVNGDDMVDSADAIYLLYHTLFGSERYPINQQADYDGDSAVSSADAIYLLYHTLFGSERYPLQRILTVRPIDTPFIYVG